MPNNRCRGRPKRRWGVDIERDFETDLIIAGLMTLERSLYRYVIMKKKFLKKYAT